MRKTHLSKYLEQSTDMEQYSKKVKKVEKVGRQASTQGECGEKLFPPLTWADSQILDQATTLRRSCLPREVSCSCSFLFLVFCVPPSSCRRFVRRAMSTLLRQVLLNVTSTSYSSFLAYLTIEHLMSSRSPSKAKHDAQPTLIHCIHRISVRRGTSVIPPMPTRFQHTNTRSCVGWSGHLPSLRANKDVSPLPWRGRDRKEDAAAATDTYSLLLTTFAPGCLCCAACISLSTTIEPKPNLTNSLRSTSVSSSVAVSVTFPSCGVPQPSSEAQIFSEYQHILINDPRLARNSGNMLGEASTSPQHPRCSSCMRRDARRRSSAANSHSFNVGQPYLRPSTPRNRLVRVVTLALGQAAYSFPASKHSIWHAVILLFCSDDRDIRTLSFIFGNSQNTEIRYIISRPATWPAGRMLCSVALTNKVQGPAKLPFLLRLLPHLEHQRPRDKREKTTHQSFIIQSSFSEAAICLAGFQCYRSTTPYGDGQRRMFRLILQTTCWERHVDTEDLFSGSATHAELRSGPLADTGNGHDRDWSFSFCNRCTRVRSTNAPINYFPNGRVDSKGDGSRLRGQNPSGPGVSVPASDMEGNETHVAAMHCNSPARSPSSVPAWAGNCAARLVVDLVSNVNSTYSPRHATDSFSFGRSSRRVFPRISYTPRTIPVREGAIDAHQQSIDYLASSPGLSDGRCFRRSNLSRLLSTRTPPARSTTETSRLDYGFFPTTFIGNILVSGLSIFPSGGGCYVRMSSRVDELTEYMVKCHSPSDTAHSREGLLPVGPN
ncbi:uncharacterized protein CLUP02_08659 [Colletotrichum lupini]|uniref:Uncharacterized protein n=1 Tax=Colletotrichum lupini TaxID=145971 RepID=A0A9Q8WHU4_9PEZI|nr:uncharacterized protein CLUP02_08659 [Colletotrichum lupini]UQC83165.1 hypothetical protein CLUP02_08659 [Colletotrichum lupini]